MSIILKRTVFCEAEKSSPLRFADWARVITPQGTMAEPFTTIFLRNAPDVDIEDYDPTEEMCRVDEIEFTNLDKVSQNLSGGELIHGGDLHPRVGR
jgi:hypothetical protein